MEWLALLMAFIAGGLAATVAMLAVGWRGDTAEEAVPHVGHLPPRPVPAPSPPAASREVVELHVKEM